MSQSNLLQLKNHATLVIISLREIKEEEDHANTMHLLIQLYKCDDRPSKQTHT